MYTHTSDLLVIGAGLSGERVAVESALAGFDVVCLSIVPARRSHSSAAQGGMQAAIGNCAMGEGDNPDVHFLDTVKGSDWGCDQEVARMFADTAPMHFSPSWMREMASLRSRTVMPSSAHLLSMVHMTAWPVPSEV